MPKLGLLALVLFGLCACGSPRQMGDVGGLPVQFEVLLDRSFVGAMENRQGKMGASAGVTVGSGGTRTGVGFGLSFQSTNVYLYGGNAAGQANLFRKRIKWGVNQFEVPLKPGRKVVFTAVVSGGRSGWETIGAYAVLSKDNAVRITLSESGGTVQAVKSVSSAR